MKTKEITARKNKMKKHTKDKACIWITKKSGKYPTIQRTFTKKKYASGQEVRAAKEDIEKNGKKIETEMKLCERAYPYFYSYFCFCFYFYFYSIVIIYHGLFGFILIF